MRRVENIRNPCFRDHERCSRPNEFISSSLSARQNNNNFLTLTLRRFNEIELKRYHRREGTLRRQCNSVRRRDGSWIIHRDNIIIRRFVHSTTRFIYSTWYNNAITISLWCAMSATFYRLKRKRKTIFLVSFRMILLFFHHGALASIRLWVLPYIII